MISLKMRFSLVHHDGEPSENKPGSIIVKIIFI